MKYLPLIAILLLSCSSSDRPADTTAPAAPLPDANSVELSIDKAPGMEEYIANCQTCHTARYVEMQPKLSRKAWEKIVDKMVHTYGASIDSSTCIRIVDYLMARQ